MTKLSAMTLQEKQALLKKVVWVKNPLGRVVRTTEYHYNLLSKNNHLTLVDAPKAKKVEKKVEKKTEEKA